MRDVDLYVDLGLRLWRVVDRLKRHASRLLQVCLALVLMWIVAIAYGWHTLNMPLARYLFDVTACLFFGLGGVAAGLFLAQLAMQHVIKQEPQSHD